MGRSCLSAVSAPGNTVADDGSTINCAQYFSEVMIIAIVTLLGPNGEEAPMTDDDRTGQEREPQDFLLDVQARIQHAPYGATRPMGTRVHHGEPRSALRARA